MLPYTTNNNVKELVKEELKENAPSVLIWDKPFLSDENLQVALSFISNDEPNLLVPTLLTEEELESFNKYNFVQFKNGDAKLLTQVNHVGSTILTWNLSVPFFFLREIHLAILLDSEDPDNPYVALSGTKMSRGGN